MDGRLFAAQIPDYVSRHELLAFAGVPDFPGLRVWAGVEMILLDTEEPIHTYPGMLISFKPAGQEPDAPYSLGQLLQFLSGWDSAPTWPEPRFGPACALVRGGHTSLISAHHSDPTQYRQVIGEATGAHPARFRLFAATPRPTDASVNGVFCRAVIAVTECTSMLSSVAWHSIIVDRRPIQAGWLDIVLPDGLLDVAGLVAQLGATVPLGWFVHVDVLPDHTGHVRCPPGHVITVT